MDNPQKHHVPVPVDALKFEVKSRTAVENPKLPQYKCATEIMNETNMEGVFQKLLDQPIAFAALPY